MITLAAILSLMWLLFLAYVVLFLTYVVGRACGYEDAMKANGWRSTTDGWYKETP